MYDWLIEEEARVKWKNFFLFHRDVSEEALDRVEHEFGVVPESYAAFLRQFGEARLFRDLEKGSYRLAVFSRPKLRLGRNDELLLEIGYYINGGYAHFRKQAGAENPEPGIFEGAGVDVRKAAPSFGEWLQWRFASAKKLYKKSEWKQIEAGAAPFTAEELKLLEAIKLFSFDRVGILANGDIELLIHNGSPVHLPYLTIGAKVPGRLDGTVYLNVSHIGPGETKKVHQACYKSIVPPDQVELYRKPLPEPEERRMYYEFGPPEWMTK